MATTQSKSFKGGAIAAGTGLYGTVLPINTDENGNVTNNGNLLTVTGNNAWAEGERTKATAGRAHAEGYMTEAFAADSHAEGSNTKAGGAESHAEGAGTIASGQGAHAEGGSTHATGQYSHSEGYNTQATRLTSHAEGRDTEASHVCSHAEGYKTKASGESSHSEGENTEASGQGSHAEGGACVASGDYSHASGEGTRATDRGTTAVGRFNSDGTALFVVGDGVNPDEGGRSDAFKVDRLGRTHVKNEAGRLVKLRGAGIATFTVSRSGGTYTYPNANDVIDAISNYDEVILQLVSSMEGTYNYVYDYSLITNEYRWIREDGSHVITLTGAGSPLVWTWGNSNRSLGGGSQLYATLQDAIADAASLNVGDYFETNGFHTSGDGGAARYVVSSSGTANGMDIVQLATGKVAIFQWSDEVHPEQLGAYGDGTTDDTSVFDYIINMFSSVTRDMQVKRAIVGSFDKRYRVNDLYIHDCTLQRCVFKGSGSTVGIGLKIGSRAIIDRCIIFDFKNAIYTEDADSAISAVITGCTISWCGNGINLATGTTQQASVDNILIEKNYISRMGTLGHSSDTTPPNWDNTGCGIWLNGNWKGVNIVDNVLEYNGFTGIRLECNRTDLEPSCTITENYLEGNKDSAIRIQMQNRPCAVSIFGNQMTKSDVNVFVTTGIFCTKLMSSGEVESPYGEFIGVVTTDNGSSVITANADNIYSSNIIIYPSDVVSNTFEITPAKCSNSKSSRKIFHLNLYARAAAALGLRITYKDKNGISQTSNFSVEQNTASVIEIPLTDVNLYDATNSPITCEITSTLSDLFYILITDMWIK